MSERIPLEWLDGKRRLLDFQDLMTFHPRPLLSTPQVEFPDPPEPPPQPPGPTRLAIDFGTSAIAMALVSGNQVTPLEFETTEGVQPILDSPVALRTARDRASLGDNYDLDLPHLRSAVPGWAYFPGLKRRIELLARRGGSPGWEGWAILDVAAICMKAIVKARGPQGRPLRELLEADFEGPVVLSVPNSFPDLGVGVLRRGVAYGVAAALGLPSLPAIETLLEAEAVAYRALHNKVNPSVLRTVLVIDAGAGTTDASIVRLDDDAVRVLAHTGLPVGGLDLDALIAQVNMPLAKMDRQQLSQNLRRAGEQKVKFWGHREPPSGGGPGPTVQEKVSAGAENLCAAFDKSGDGEADRWLKEGYRRFLALAVRALIRSLPIAEVGRIDRVILSGRGSLLLGFEEEVREVVKEYGIESDKVTGAGADLNRKLMVVQGVAEYARSPRSLEERRPRRAGHDLVLRHRLLGDKLVLVRTGAPLLDGWAVRAWYQPGAAEPGLWASIVEAHLIPETVLSELDGFQDSDGLRENLETWCRREVCQFAAHPPYVAWCTYDFLSQSFVGEVDGGPELKPRVSGPAEGLGLLHPVHLAQEDWFEYFLGEQA